MVFSLSLRWLVFSAFLQTVFAVHPEPIQKRDDSIARRQSSSDMLDMALRDMAMESVEFSSENTTGLPYNATTKFNPRGMGELYNVTNIFINIIHSKPALPQGMIINEGKFVMPDFAEDWKVLLKYYGVLLGFIVAGLLFAVLLPFIGLFFCCCRCAGNCGARTQPFDKKHDHCRKVFLSIFLIAVATIILFGVVCAFVTNEYMQEGTVNLPNRTRVNLNDVQLYMKTLDKEIEHVLIENYHELERSLNSTLEKSGKTITDELARQTKAVSLHTLDEMVNGLTDVKNDLNNMDKITKLLRSNIYNLTSGVSKVKNNVLNGINECKHPVCAGITANVSIMQVNATYDALPNVTPELNHIKDLIDKNIVDEVGKGKTEFENIQNEIQREVNDAIPKISGVIRIAGNQIASISKSLTNITVNANEKISEILIPKTFEMQSKIDKYSIYRYYLSLGVSCVLLMILLCLTFGLLCGICGKRPDGYGDDCCNKGSGSRFLMMAVWIIFLLTSLLIIITTVFMIIGVVINRGVCEPLKHPQDNQLINSLENYLKLQPEIIKINEIHFDLNIADIISRCHGNYSFYQVLNPKNISKFDTIKDNINFELDNEMKKLHSKIHLKDDIKILTEDAKKNLKELANSNLSSLPFYQYAAELNANLTNVNLLDISNELDTAVNLLNSVPDLSQYVTVLTDASEDIKRIESELLQKIKNDSEKLVDQAEKLENHIKFNHSSMSEAIRNLTADVEDAEKALNAHGPEYIEHITVKFSKIFLNKFFDYVNHVNYSMRNTIGKCYPLSNVYNATIVDTCNRIVDPFNGFWISVGWCIILFIPTIILCVKLSALYQKSDPYPGSLVESEYLYDAYADRDNMPLAHVHDKKHGAHSRHHPHAYVESYDGPAEREVYRGRDSRQGSSHHDSRYSDHAPNFEAWKRHDRVASSKPKSQNNIYSIPLDSQNWDFPNGGPPRYQPPPGAPPLSTEYERPPPYYYPGPGPTN